MNKVRGFEIAKGYEDKGVVLPKRSTKGSAGYDFRSLDEVEVKPGYVADFVTGVKAYMQDDEVLKIYARSSFGKKGLVIPNSVGIIDSDYYGNEDNDGVIHVMLLNVTDEPVLIKKDERIAQGIFEKYLITDDDNADGERVGGIGSTGEL